MYQRRSHLARAAALVAILFPLALGSILLPDSGYGSVVLESELDGADGLDEEPARITEAISGEPARASQPAPLPSLAASTRPNLATASPRSPPSTDRLS